MKKIFLFIIIDKMIRQIYVYIYVFFLLIFSFNYSFSMQLISFTVYLAVIRSCKNQLQGVQKKLCFFTIQCNPSLAYNVVKDLQRNASRSHWLVIFCTTNSSRVLARERWQTFENSWKITQ